MVHWKDNRSPEYEPRYKSIFNNFLTVIFVLGVLTLLFFAFHNYTFKKVGVSDDNLIDNTYSTFGEVEKKGFELYGDVNKEYVDDE